MAEFQPGVIVIFQPVQASATIGLEFSIQSNGFLFSMLSAGGRGKEGNILRRGCD